MKVSNKFGIVITSLLLGATACLGGCATTGMQRADKTSVSMKTVELDINAAVAQVDVTDASLNDLVRPGQPEAKKTFLIFSANVDKMEKLGSRLFEHADKMNAQGKNYFDEWQKQGNGYANPEIQALSEQRRVELSAVYGTIATSSVGVKGAAKAYLSNLKEIQSYLSNDLTAKGLEAITPVAHKAVSDGENLKEAAKPVLSAIANVRVEMEHGATK